MQPLVCGIQGFSVFFKAPEPFFGGFVDMVTTAPYWPPGGVSNHDPFCSPRGAAEHNHLLGYHLLRSDARNSASETPVYGSNVLYQVL
jgi:hypothetical protein